MTRPRTYPFKNNMSDKKRREPRKFYPKGFDINLSEVLAEFVMGDEEIKRLGSDRTIASAYVGNAAYYRRAQLETMFAKAPTRALPTEYDDVEPLVLNGEVVGHQVKNGKELTAVWVDEATVPNVIDISDIKELRVIEDDEEPEMEVKLGPNGPIYYTPGLED